MRRKPLLTVLGAAALASVVFTAVSLASGSKPATGTTMHLIEHDVAFNFVPVVPGPRKGKAAKPGDTATFVSYLTTKAGQRVGHTYVSCTATTGGTNPSMQCQGTATLPGGTLTVSALIHGGSSGPQRIAIVGGTGSYEGASGSILSVPKTETTSADTLHLLP